MTEIWSNVTGFFSTMFQAAKGVLGAGTDKIAEAIIGPINFLKDLFDFIIGIYNYLPSPFNSMLAIFFPVATAIIIYKLVRGA